MIGKRGTMSQSLRKSGRLFPRARTDTRAESTIRSQSLRKSGRLFRKQRIRKEFEAPAIVSQSLRKSGRLFQHQPVSNRQLANMCRNPFVNQVVCFDKNKWWTIESLQKSRSQSLRKSGRLFQSWPATLIAIGASQSLRKSGRLFQRRWDH